MTGVTEREVPAIRRPRQLIRGGPRASEQGVHLADVRPCDRVRRADAVGVRLGDTEKPSFEGEKGNE
jgi:hypothetical protein